MGRSRKGIIEQSSKKPKAQKNRERGFIWGLHKIDNPHYENKELPILVSEELLAEMKKMSSQELMNILLPDNANNVSLTSEKKNCQLTDAIQILPPELREIIYKEYIKIKLRERKALGWDEINAAIKEAPVCEKNHQIVKVLFCYKFGNCMRNCLCNLCKRNGVNHYLGYPIYDENDYDECFKKSCYNSWSGVVA